MAWAGFPKVSLGDLAGAVNKLQESVKSIEKNFDTALGLDQLQKPDTQDASVSAAPAKPAVASALDGWGWGLKAETPKAQTPEGPAQATPVTEPAKETVLEVPKKGAIFRRPPVQKRSPAKAAVLEGPKSQEGSSGGLDGIAGSEGVRTAWSGPPTSVRTESSGQPESGAVSGVTNQEYQAGSTGTLDITPETVSAPGVTEGAGVSKESRTGLVAPVNESGLRVSDAKQPAGETTTDVDSVNTPDAEELVEVASPELDSGRVSADVSATGAEADPEASQSKVDEATSADRKDAVMSEKSALFSGVNGDVSDVNGGEEGVISDASGVNPDAGSVNAHLKDVNADGASVNADASCVNAHSVEPVTLARIVEGVGASQPFGHGDETAQEENLDVPKMTVADAFPSAATPQFKPHAEAASVVDLEASSRLVLESVEAGSSRGLGEVSNEAESRKERLDEEPVEEAKVSSEGGSFRTEPNRPIHAETSLEEANSVANSTSGKPDALQTALAELDESGRAAVFEESLEEAPSVGDRGKSADDFKGALGSAEETELSPGVGTQGRSLGGQSDGGGRLDDGQRSDGGGQSGSDVRLDGSGRSNVVGRTDDGGVSDELSQLREELKGMEVALQHAAKQAQTKANELAEMGTVNDNLRAELEELKRKKADDSDLEALRAEYQHRLGTAERKVYALTKERDMLRRESSRKSDTSTLLKEKDEIIKQVMAEGEELSKKQAAVEGQMRKLRGTIRELEVERDRLTSRLQVEEAKTESIQTDKAKTERQLADAVERAQAELAAQKESYTAALQETKEALAKAEAAADTTRRSELDKKVKEAAEREAELVRQLEEVREQMVRDAQSAAAREDRLRRDQRELEARCQDAEARHSELIARVPDSTRPLLRQIEALQEAAASRAEAWGAVERSLNARVQDAEVSAAGAQERERAAGERLTQAASRMAVMEAQVSMLRAEQAALQRSLEKERSRAGETRQELLTLKEAAAVHEGRAAQLDDEMKEMRAKQRKESQEGAKKRDALEQELAGLRAERDKWRAGQATAVPRVPERNGPAVGESVAEATSDRRMSRRPSNASSAGSSMEEGAYLQASLQGVPFSGAFDGTAPPWIPGPRGSVSASLVEQLEALLRQREGELASYSSRLASLESTRDALAEELVKTTQQTEELAREAALLPSLRAELDSLRRRHASALELMGERDEEVEELRADLHDHKSMYRDQIDMLVKQIERQSKSEVR